MLGTYEGADGLKTGYTVASGFNLVMSAMRGNSRLIGVVMGGNSAGMRDRIMAELMDRGFASGRLSPWTTVRKPPSARYTAANFDPSLIIPASTPKIAVAKAAPAAPAVAAVAIPAAVGDQRVAGPAAPSANPAAQRNLAVGSWVIQVGSFGDAQSAQLALERASSALPDTMRTGFASVDEVQMANKTFHRARLTNLSQTQAIDGCKRLEKRKIYCSAIQVTVWNTPGAR
jgi:D-alanyl-D-alanine carboxypeptidase